MPDIFDQIEPNKTPLTPLPKQAGKKGDLFDDIEETSGPPSAGDVARMGAEEAKTRLRSLPGALATHAPAIGSAVGGIAGTALGAPVAGAFTGGAIGQGIKDQYDESQGGPKMSGPAAAFSMAETGIYDALAQEVTPAVMSGLSEMGMVVARKGMNMLEGAAPEALSVTPKGPFAPMPTPPSSFTPGSVAPGAAETSLANSQLLTAQGASALANEAKDATARALKEGLDALPHAGTLGQGQEIQGGLKAASDIWKREGGILYDKARAATQDLPIPIKAFRAIGDQVAMENQATSLAFPKSGGYEPKIKGILDDITNLGIIKDEEGNIIGQSDTIPFQALDGFRSKLVALSNDSSDQLTATQAQGILKKFTSVLTDTMEKGLGNTPEAAAWREARKFWGEGKDIFDHAVITKAINANPEQVIASLTPASGTRAAAITEAQQFRNGLLEYVKKNGTPEEIDHATKIYNRLLSNFTERNLVGPGGSDIVSLPKKLAGYRGMLDTLYDGTPEGQTIKDNLLTLSDSVDKALLKAKAVTSAEKNLGAVEKNANISKIKADRLAEKQIAEVAKGKQQTWAKGDAEVAEKYERARKVVRSFTTTVGASLGLGPGSLPGAGAGWTAGDILMNQVIKSRKASGMWAKEVEKAIERGVNPPDISKQIFRPGDGLAAGDSTWLFNFAKAIKATHDTKEDVEPFGPMPVRVVK